MAVAVAVPGWGSPTGSKDAANRYPWFRIGTALKGGECQGHGVVIMAAARMFDEGLPAGAQPALEHGFEELRSSVPIPQPLCPKLCPRGANSCSLVLTPAPGVVRVRSKTRVFSNVSGRQRGDCKTSIPGSNPGGASIFSFLCSVLRDAWRVLLGASTPAVKPRLSAADPLALKDVMRIIGPLGGACSGRRFVNHVETGDPAM